MSEKRTPDELLAWSLAKEQIGQQLKKHYQACTSEELPPRLLAVLEKLEEEEKSSAEETRHERQD